MSDVFAPAGMYNLVWVHPLPPPPPEAPPIMSEVAYFETNSMVLVRPAPAVILFPSLMTPCVFRAPAEGESDADPWLELLIASSEAKLHVEQVNQQLKIYAGLSVEKMYHPEPLFTGTAGHIEVQPAPADSLGLVRTHKRFSGVIHKSVLDRLRKTGLDKLYRVRVHHHALLNAIDATTALRPPGQSDEQKLKWRAEKHDELIKEMLETRHKSQGDAATLPGMGMYAFNTSADGVRLWNQDADPKSGEAGFRAVNWQEPVQSYHPVFFHQPTSKPAVLNYGHLTDIHINGRVNLLQRSPARVIEKHASFDGSTSVGELIEPTNRAFQRLLSAIAKDDEAQALLIGGDLIDHQMNAFAKGPPAKTMEAVWEAVSLTDQKTKYVRGVDMVSFYTMLVDFCRTSGKPAFGVSGNHDCYVAPFGISPRVLWVRANAGIPADLNLTLYEALLAFGPTFSDVKVPTRVGHAPSSFDEAWMEWFYTVFTPFSDFRVQLPRQQLVCLGWGDSEDMVLGDEQGLIHLPRADDSVSEVQLKLAKDAARDHVARPVTLLTHFTLASFEEKVPMLTRGRETVGMLDSTTNQYTMGTFETGRDAFLKLLSERSITCVLTGHSHRRGLYFLGSRTDHLLDSGSGTAVTMYEPRGFAIRSVPEDRRRPAIVVSDSAGPYPRYNRSGEFEGWGSDKPGGSVVKFDERGELSAVEVVQSDQQERPRLAVCLDYFDIDRESVWALGGIQTAPFTMDEQADMRRGKMRADGSFYRLRLALSERLPAALRVVGLSFHGGMVKPLTLQISGRLQECPLYGDDNKRFYEWCQRSADPDRFVSVSFAWDDPRAQQYKDGPWTYEVRLQARARGTTMWYAATRPRRFVGVIPFYDVPDFDWRKGKAQKRAANVQPTKEQQAG